MNALLEVSGLGVAFATPDGTVRAVDAVSFAVARGTTLGIAGESGSGKSQTLLALTGLLPRNATVTGEMRWDGELTPLTARAPFTEGGRRPPDGGGMLRSCADLRGKHIAYVFQDPLSALNPYRTIGAQLGETLALHRGLGGAAARARSVELLAQVRVPDAASRLDAYPHQLSGGQRQRALIAMALAGEPDLLLLDEPTTALDVTVQAQVLALLRELQASLGLTMIIVSHDLGVLAALADRVLVMRGGRVVESAAAAALFAAPQAPYTRELLAAAKRLESGVHA